MKIKITKHYNTIIWVLGLTIIFYFHKKSVDVILNEPTIITTAEVIETYSGTRQSTWCVYKL